MRPSTRPHRPTCYKPNDAKGRQIIVSTPESRNVLTCLWAGFTLMMG